MALAPQWGDPTGLYGSWPADLTLEGYFTQGGATSSQFRTPGQARMMYPPAHAMAPGFMKYPPRQARAPGGWVTLRRGTAAAATARGPKQATQNPAPGGTGGQLGGWTTNSTPQLESASTQLAPETTALAELGEGWWEEGWYPPPLAPRTQAPYEEVPITCQRGGFIYQYSWFWHLSTGRMSLSFPKVAPIRMPPAAAGFHAEVQDGQLSRRQ